MKRIGTIIFYVFRKLYSIAEENKHHHRLYAYYAFPVLIGLLVTFVITRFVIAVYPSVGFSVNGVHVHHFISGIFIVLLAGYFALWVQVWKLKYIIALAYGTGAAFILDEFYVWLRLNPSVINHDQYDAVIITVSLLLLVLLLPSGVHGISRLFGQKEEMVESKSL